MSVHQTGTKNGQWKGGRVVTPSGYIIVRVGVAHHLADRRGYAYEHRVVAEQALGRRLRRGEVVHHKNHKRGDNRPVNLEVLSRWSHGVAHRKHATLCRLPSEPNIRARCACGCGASFWRFDYMGRRRRFVSGHNITHGADGRWASRPE